MTRYHYAAIFLALLLSGIGIGYSAKKGKPAPPPAAQTDLRALDGQDLKLLEDSVRIGLRFKAERAVELANYLASITLNGRTLGDAMLGTDEIPVRFQQEVERYFNPGLPEARVVSFTLDTSPLATCELKASSFSSDFEAVRCFLRLKLAGRVRINKDVPRLTGFNLPNGEKFDCLSERAGRWVGGHGNFAPVFDSSVKFDSTKVAPIYDAMPAGDIRTELARFEDFASSYKQRADTLDATVQQLKGEKTRLEQQAAGSGREAEDARKRLGEVQQQLSAAKREKGELTDKAKKLAEKVEALESSEAFKKLGAEKAEMERRVRELEAKVNTLQALLLHPSP